VRPEAVCYAPLREAGNFWISPTTFSPDLNPGRFYVKGSRKAAKVAKKIDMNQKGKIIRDFFTADI
jgi:hypothetical protein